MKYCLTGEQDLLTGSGPRWRKESDAAAVSRTGGRVFPAKIKLVWCPRNSVLIPAIFRGRVNKFIAAYHN